MSKLSFRARALDPSKQMPIFLAEELPDLPEYSAINRAVPQMPSGMEKEEESVSQIMMKIFRSSGDYFPKYLSLYHRKDCVRFCILSAKIFSKCSFLTIAKYYEAIE